MFGRVQRRKKTVPLGCDFGFCRDENFGGRTCLLRSARSACFLKSSSSSSSASLERIKLFLSRQRIILRRFYHYADKGGSNLIAAAMQKSKI